MSWTPPGRRLLLPSCPVRFRRLFRAATSTSSCSVCHEIFEKRPKLDSTKPWNSAPKVSASNPQTGEAILRLATTLYPEDAGAHFNLGIAEEALDKTADSIAEYERALAIQSDLAQVYLNLGGALVSSGQLDKATRVYRKGIEVDPLGASLHWSLGIALQREGKVDEANRELALAAKIDPKLIASQSGK